MKKILVVEDEMKINELIFEFFKSEGYEVDNAYDGVVGYSKFKENKYDLVILDIMMPKLHGYRLCNLIREKSNVPIFVRVLVS